MVIARMARALAVAGLCTTPALAEGAGIALPSGREVVFHDTVWGQPGPAGLAIRFRFIEPDLATVLDVTPYEDLEADMAFLCESFAIDRITKTGPQPSTVMISISNRPVAFGEPDPDVTQVFEAYRPEAGTCIWEGF